MGIYRTSPTPVCRLGILPQASCSGLSAYRLKPRNTRAGAILTSPLRGLEGNRGSVRLRVGDDEKACGDVAGACALEPRRGGIIIASARARRAKSPQGEFAHVRGPGFTDPAS